MVRCYSTNYTYDFPLPTVSLAYFLRYPNPYSKHVVSSDVIERHFDPDTHRLHTTRLHLKRSRMPPAVLKLLPRSFFGAQDRNGDGQSYILETSTVDVREGWMRTESRNLEWTGVLSVVERQHYTDARPPGGEGGSSSSNSSAAPEAQRPLSLDGRTDVETVVTLRSPLGEQRLKQRRQREAAEAESGDDEGAQQRVGFFRSWGQKSLQRSIELIGLRRTEKSQPNAKEGMKVVLERFRQGGLVAVLEGMRRDRPDLFAGAGLGADASGAAWRRVKGDDDGEDGL